MQKILILFFSVLVYSTISAQILLQEDFESGTIPAGWVNQSSATDGGFLVGSAAALSSTYFSIVSNGSANIAVTNDDGCNCNKRNERFITPTLDFSGLTSIALSFDSYFTDLTGQQIPEDALIQVSTDMITWEVMEDLHGHGFWDKHSIDISSFAGEPIVYIAFAYDDGGGWLYGFGIDNVLVEVPPMLEVGIVALDERKFGEVNRNLAISGTIVNNGVVEINSLNFTYTINGANPVNHIIDNIAIPTFSFYNFDIEPNWIPDAPGFYTIDVNLNQVNGQTDMDATNDMGSYDTEIYEEVIVPNKIEDFVSREPVINELTGASSMLNRPMDLDFFPILGKDELWVVNERNESSGGSTLTVADATDETPSNYLHRVDGNAWHFMSLPTAIAFSPDNFNFATSSGVQDANHSGGTFTGPTLWSSDPDIYAQPSGGSGSHLDMLHGSPRSLGIAHEVDNTFWLYDNYNKHIVRYDFVDDHGPGNDDHSDAIVWRYRNIGINGDTDIPNHILLDENKEWLYFVDNGNDRVMRLDVNSSTSMINLPEINEPLSGHFGMVGFVTEEIISGLDRPSGLEIFENYLLIGEYETGDIIIYEMDNNFAELGRISTTERGLTGIKVGPDGNIWCTNRLMNHLYKIEPGEPIATNNLAKVDFYLSPNPANSTIYISLQEADQYEDFSYSITTMNGKQIRQIQDLQSNRLINVSDIHSGVYLLTLQNSEKIAKRKVVISR